MSLVDEVQRPRRRPSLTPMIDVVFLLLVFFMLASRFGVDMALPLPLASGGAQYNGPPRLVDILPDGQRLNGQDIPLDSLTERLRSMTDTRADVIVLRGPEGTPLQRVVTVADALRAAGFTQLVLIE